MAAIKLNNISARRRHKMGYNRPASYITLELARLKL